MKKAASKRRSTTTRKVKAGLVDAPKEGRTPDPGVSEAAKIAIAPGVDTSNWERIEMPRLWSSFKAKNGEAVFRREVAIPANWAGQDLIVSLGRIDDFDVTFWNSEQIGATKDWFPERTYTIPGRLVKAGKNVLAVRVFDDFGGDGFGASPDQMFLNRQTNDLPPVYHPDYRADFELGDEPHRHFRW